MKIRTTALIVLLAGCATAPPVVTVRFHEEVSDKLPASHVRIVAVPQSALTVAVDPFPVLTEKNVAEAKVQPTVGGDAVWLKFDMHGTHLLEELTTRTRGQYVVIFLEDKPVAAVRLERIIADGQFLLEGNFSDADARRLVESINSAVKRRRDYGDTRY